MVAVVDDAGTSVDIVADGSGTCPTTHAAVLLGHGFVGVVQQGVTDIVDVHIVGFAEVAVSGTFVGADADALVEPGEAFGHVTLIIQHLVDMGVHVVDVLHRETANKHFKVVVVAFQLTKPVVGAAAIH